MVKHIVEITVPRTEDNLELVIDVEVFAISNHFPFGDVEGIHKSAMGNLISTLADDDPYRVVIEKTAKARSKGTENMQQGYYVPGKVCW